MSPVCILAAGSGSRMGELGSVTHKALLPLKEQPILSHLFARFGPARDYVIALGPFAKDIRDYCALAHPGLRISWVEVSPLSGPGSGPGRSLLCCRSHLRRAFFFVCSDTIWSEEIEQFDESDWIGVAPVPRELTSDYCIARCENLKVRELIDKKKTDSGPLNAFIGLAHIRNHEIFFEGLDKGLAREPMDERGECSLALGLNALIAAQSLDARVVPSWVDTGTLEKYQSATRSGQAGFQKSGEFFYRTPDRVIKFFKDESSAQNRMKRGVLLGPLVPRELRACGRFLSYRYEAGPTFYEVATLGRFSLFLDWVDQELWSQPASLKQSDFKKQCRKFYEQKTQERLELFYQKYPQANSWENPVLGETTLAMDRLLTQLPWGNLENGVPTPFHGDLHFDNVVCGSPEDPQKLKFYLIDWRGDFGGDLSHGDLAYEFAKLRLGIEIHLLKIRNGEFSLIEDADGSVRYRLPEMEDSSSYLQILDEFAAKKGIDLENVRWIEALACINMAALHEAPLDRLIFHEGRRRLSRLLTRGS